MKKKIMAILLMSTLSIFALAGCTGETEESAPAETESPPAQSESAASVVDTYREMAQEFLDKEDYGAAVSILEKGIDATGDAGLADLLKEVLALQLSAEPTAEPTPVITMAPAPEPTIDPGLDELEQADHPDKITVAQVMNLFDMTDALGSYYNDVSRAVNSQNYTLELLEVGSAEFVADIGDDTDVYASFAFHDSVWWLEVAVSRYFGGGTVHADYLYESEY